MDGDGTVKHIREIMLDIYNVGKRKWNWTGEPVGPPLVSQLREKAERVRWGPDTRDEEFALFSKSGFVDGLADDVGDNWSLFGLGELGGVL